MKIFIANNSVWSDGPLPVTYITHYLNFNEIEAAEIDIWNDNYHERGRYDIPKILEDSENSLLILEPNVFLELCSFEPTFNKLIEFCLSNNYIWVWSDNDALLKLTRFPLDILEKIKFFNLGKSIRFFLDGTPLPNHQINNLGIDYKIFPSNIFFSVLRIFGSVVNKKDCSKDFLLTMVKHINRPHRAVLWNELQNIPTLLDHGHVNFLDRKDKRDKKLWLGKTPNQPWWDHYPSMDLYLDSWFEVVPETLYDYGYFITEKTIKPIATKTPFLILSTSGFLHYLKQQGFQTFSSLISEKYDQIHNIEDKTKLLVLEMQDIIKNGSEEFYKASSSILEHNQQRFFEIAGQRQYAMDCFIEQNLTSLPIFKK
jgi:hypothetical protein